MGILEVINDYPNYDKALFETKGTVKFRGSMGKGGWIMLTFSMEHNGVL